MNKNSKIYISGHNGLVGSAIIRLLKSSNYNNIITQNRSELDLTNNQAVEHFFSRHRPEYVFMAAAKVGGIQYNKQYPADFIRDNLLIQNNIIDTSHKYGVTKLCFLGSSCIYPKLADVPINESSLLTGPLEETNEAYAIAKISGYFMCKKYTEQYGFNTISLMPANLYGINDNFRPQESHVIPALIKKFVDAKNLNLPYVKNFGDGGCTREFLHVDDLADAMLFLMLNYNDSSIINIGTGVEISIREVCSIIKNIIGYNGDVVWDTTYPNGTPRRFLDISKITNLGWKPKINLMDGLKSTIEWYLNNQQNILVRS